MYLCVLNRVLQDCAPEKQAQAPMEESQHIPSLGILLWHKNFRTRVPTHVLWQTAPTYTVYCIYILYYYIMKYREVCAHIHSWTTFECETQFMQLNQWQSFDAKLSLTVRSVNKYSKKQTESTIKPQTRGVLFQNLVSCLYSHSEGHKWTV